MTQRRTVQKDMISAALREMRNHPTAEEVHSYIRRTCPSVSRATVYRVLRTMAENGSVLRIPVPDGADHYDHLTHRHFHFRCEVCGRVGDMSLRDSYEPLALVENCDNAALTGYSLLFHGVCESCRAKAEASFAPKG